MKMTREEFNEKGEIEYRQITVQDAKNEICEKLGMIERPYTTFITDPVSRKVIKVPPGCTVTLTYRNMSELAKRIDDYKEKYFPEFERSLTSFLRRAKAQWNRSDQYASFKDRLLGNAPKVSSMRTHKYLCSDVERAARDGN